MGKRQTVEIKDVIEIIDKQIEFLKQQNGVMALLAFVNWAECNNVDRAVKSNRNAIKELTDMRMKVLELSL